ncbi:hypothetical protein, partial [Salmonella sp. s55004]|uniref:hypothetical protein n=1 Tax=Salmonella sp. s55004 TaxID=3159675 RepID=UPI003981454A
FFYKKYLSQNYHCFVKERKGGMKIIVNIPPAFNIYKNNEISFIQNVPRKIKQNLQKAYCGTRFEKLDAWVIPFDRE